MSRTSPAGLHCEGSWTSDKIGSCNFSRTSARICRPSFIPKPRNDLIDVRFALSYDALKTNFTRCAAAIFFNSVAMKKQWSLLSMTQGPAIRKKSRLSSGYSSCTDISVLRHPVFVRRINKGCEQWMRCKRLGFEFRMELAAKEPGMILQFDDLNEVLIGRHSGNDQ